MSKHSCLSQGYRKGRLFPLEPLGRGGAAVESLTSYIARLAQAHFLPTWILVMQELVPLFKRQSITDGRGQCDLFSNVGGSLNGLAGIAAETVERIQFLTKSRCLEDLTLLPLKGVISTRSSIRRRRTWCPMCFRTWKEKREPIREILVWQIKTVRVCPFHPMQALEEKCPHCDKHQLPLARYSVPGFCSVCKGWLGVQHPGDRRPVSGVTGIDQRLAEEVRLLIESIGKKTCLPSLSILRGNLCRLQNQLFAGRVSAFAKAAGLHHSTVADVLKGCAVPGLDTVLQLSIAADVRAVKILEMPLDSSSNREIGRAGGLCVPRKTVRRYDWPQINRELLKIKKANSRLSLHRFCLSKRMDPGYVAKHLPDSARPIMVDYRNAVAIRHKTRLNEEETELSGAVKALALAGKWPSFRRIKRRLLKPGLLRNPKLVTIRKQMLGIGRGGPNE